MKFWDDINKAVEANNRKTKTMSEAALRRDWKRKQKQRGNPKVTIEEVRTLTLGSNQRKPKKWKMRFPWSPEII